MNKFLHHPQQALNKAGDTEREQLLRALERLYPLAGESPEE
jgi:glutamyl-tRNA reductase